MKNKTKTLSEHQIQNQIIEHLTIKGWKVLRLNSGNMTKTYKGKTYFIKGQDAGTPDLMCFKPFQYKANTAVDLYFIEVKVPSHKPTALQTTKMEELEGYGAKCLVIHSIEELQKEGL